MIICCIGAGYVGGPTCAVIAYKCPDIQVFVCDSNEKKIEKWNSDQLPIYEPGLDEIVKACRGKNLFFSNDIDGAIAAADIIFVSVNTPTKTTGLGAGKAADLKYVENATRKICEVSKSSKIVVEKSTVPCRTSDSMRKILDANSREGLRFDIISNPEFLSEGTAIRDLLNPDRILIGGVQDEFGKRAQNILADIYARWIPRSNIIMMNLWSSELSKLAANAFLAQRISSINALSAICEKTGANIEEVSFAVGKDSRIGPNFLKPSLGFGGSCFPKDINSLIYLCESLNLTEVAQYWSQVVSMNEYQKERFVKNVVKSMFGTIAGKSISIFGFSFKKNTGDTRNSAAIMVAKRLVEEQGFIHIYDPKVVSEDIMNDLRNVNTPDAEKYVSVFNDPYQCAMNTDAIIICTEWDEFSTLDYDRMYESMRKPAFIFDGRSILDLEKLKNIGFEVACIGKSFAK